MVVDELVEPGRSVLVASAAVDLVWTAGVSSSSESSSQPTSSSVDAAVQRYSCSVHISQTAMS